MEATTERVYPLTPYQALALTKFRPGRGVRDAAEPVEDKEIDLRVRVYGHVSVLPDTERSEAERLDPWRIVCVLVSLMGVKNVRKLVKMGVRAREELAAVKGEFQSAYDQVAERKTVRRRGDVRGKIQVDKLGRDG